MTTEDSEPKIETRLIWLLDKDGFVVKAEYEPANFIEARAAASRPSTTINVVLDTARPSTRSNRSPS